MKKQKNKRAMKKKTKTIIQAMYVAFCCGVVFFISAYSYISVNLAETDKKSQSVPYESQIPFDCGVLFNFDEGGSIYYYLSFTSNVTYVIIPETAEPIIEIQSCGYSIDYTVDAGYSLIAGIIDRLDGIELTENGVTLRYTGVQVTDFLFQNHDNNAAIRRIAESIFSKIENSGFSKQDFVYIIENSDTDLTVPDCYYWSEYMKKLFSNGKIVN